LVWSFWAVQQKLQKLSTFSLSRLKCFLYIIALLFIAELTVSIVVFATGDKIIDEIVNKADAEE